MRRAASADYGAGDDRRVYYRPAPTIREPTRRRRLQGQDHDGCGLLSCTHSTARAVTKPSGAPWPAEEVGRNEKPASTGPTGHSLKGVSLSQLSALVRGVLAVSLIAAKLTSSVQP